MDAGPAQLGRYNGQPSLEIQGQSGPGQSSGAANTNSGVISDLFERLG